MDDVVIVGGGIIGTASAYFLSKGGRKVKVIEQDPTYKKASFPLSLGPIPFESKPLTELELK